MDGAADERAVRDAAVVVEPGVLVGVELDERQRAVDGGMRLQQRIGDEVIAAQRKELRAGGDDRARLRLDRGGEFHRLAVVEIRVAVVDDGERRERVEP